MSTYTNLYVKVSVRLLTRKEILFLHYKELDTKSQHGHRKGEFD